jgi:hypothetical protein
MSLAILQAEPVLAVILHRGLQHGQARQPVRRTAIGPGQPELAAAGGFGDRLQRLVRGDHLGEFAAVGGADQRDG